MLYVKKVGEGTRKAIREKTATLVAAAHLPYRFVEQEALKNFAVLEVLTALLEYFDLSNQVISGSVGHPGQ